jgi:hypothetical protein
LRESPPPEPSYLWLGISERDTAIGGFVWLLPEQVEGPGNAVELGQKPLVYKICVIAIRQGCLTMIDSLWLRLGQ